MNEQDLYKEIILDHYHHPRKAGKLATYTHSAHIDNPFCGDVIDMYLNVVDGLVQDVSFEATGCAISIASASILSESLPKKTVERVKRLKTKDILKQLNNIELTPSRLKCALLPLEAVHRALLVKK